MKLSSSTSDRTGLFDGVLARGQVRSAVADFSWLEALLEVEGALARAEGSAGLIPAEAAAAVAEVCRTARPDIADVGAAAAESGNPVVPLVAWLRSTVPGDFAQFVHKGATSQDILDSAAMLIAQRALDPLLADLRGAADAAASLARRHRDTPMAGRTLLQQAVPTTFGLKAAGWMDGLDRAGARLAEVRATGLAAQLGGPAGTLAQLGDDCLGLAERFADELRLAAPVLPWHTMRTRPAELACALGVACGVVGKVARDVILMAQSEVAEVAEGAPGGSSAMAHKRNPVAAISAAACAAQAPGLVATLLSAMVQEHERAAGAWHAEWRPMRDLLVSTGSAAAWLRSCLEELRVDPDAMSANVAALLRTLSEREPDLGCAGELVDRALDVRTAREAA